MASPIDSQYISIAGEINPAVVEIFHQRGVQIPVLRATNTLA